MKYLPTLRGRRTQMAIGLVATVGIVLSLMSPSQTEEAAPEINPVDAVAAESEVGFAITAASWETESAVSTPNLHAEGSLETEFETGTDWQEENLDSELNRPRWENLDIAVRRDW